MKTSFLIAAGAASMLSFGSAFADDDDDMPRGATFEVTITNLTRAQVLTPALYVAHRPGYALFELGAPVSDGLAMLAETGDPTYAQAEAAASSGVLSAGADNAVIPPGKSRTITLRAFGPFKRLTVAGMLATTNDAFYAVRGITLPRQGMVTEYAMAYDAGSEANNELCSHIPGPPCAPGTGNAREPDSVGFVHVHNGVHGVGDLDPAMLDWRGPVATISVRRMK
jgi:hypothetical protein